METLCRICRNNAPSEDLVHPCKCRGSIKWVHQHCLLTWVTRSKSIQCDTCNAEFCISKVYEQNAPADLDTEVISYHVQQRVQQGFRRLVKMMLWAFFWLYIAPVSVGFALRIFCTPVWIFGQAFPVFVSNKYKKAMAGFMMINLVRIGKITWSIWGAWYRSALGGEGGEQLQDGNNVMAHGGFEDGMEDEGEQAVTTFTVGDMNWDLSVDRDPPNNCTVEVAPTGVIPEGPSGDIVDTDPDTNRSHTVSTTTNGTVSATTSGKEDEHTTSVTENLPEKETWNSLQTRGQAKETETHHRESQEEPQIPGNEDQKPQVQATQPNQHGRCSPEEKPRAKGKESEREAHHQHSVAVHTPLHENQQPDEQQEQQPLKGREEDQQLHQTQQERQQEQEEEAGQVEPQAPQGVIGEALEKMQEELELPKIQEQQQQSPSQNAIANDKDQEPLKTMQSSHDVQQGPLESQGAVQGVPPSHDDQRMDEESQEVAVLRIQEEGLRNRQPGRKDEKREDGAQLEDERAPNQSIYRDSKQLTVHTMDSVSEILSSKYRKRISFATAARDYLGISIYLSDLHTLATWRRERGGSDTVRMAETQTGDTIDDAASYCSEQMLPMYAQPQEHNIEAINFMELGFVYNIQHMYSQLRAELQDIITLLIVAVFIPVQCVDLLLKTMGDNNNIARLNDVVMSPERVTYVLAVLTLWIITLFVGSLLSLYLPRIKGLHKIMSVIQEICEFVKLFCTELMESCSCTSTFIVFLLVLCLPVHIVTNYMVRHNIIPSGSPVLSVHILVALLLFLCMKYSYKLLELCGCRPTYALQPSSNGEPIGTTTEIVYFPEKPLTYADFSGLLGFNESDEDPIVKEALQNATTREQQYQLEQKLTMYLQQAGKPAPARRPPAAPRKPVSADFKGSCEYASGKTKLTGAIYRRVPLSELKGPQNRAKNKIAQCEDGSAEHGSREKAFASPSDIKQQHQSQQEGEKSATENNVPQLGHKDEEEQHDSSHGDALPSPSPQEQQAQQQRPAVHRVPSDQKEAPKDQPLQETEEQQDQLCQHEGREEGKQQAVNTGSLTQQHQSAHKQILSLDIKDQNNSVLPTLWRDIRPPQPANASDTTTPTTTTTTGTSQQMEQQDSVTSSTNSTFDTDDDVSTTTTITEPSSGAKVISLNSSPVSTPVTRSILDPIPPPPLATPPMVEQDTSSTNQNKGNPTASSSSSTSSSSHVGPTAPLTSSSSSGTSSSSSQTINPDEHEVQRPAAIGPPVEDSTNNTLTVPVAETEQKDGEVAAAEKDSAEFKTLSIIFALLRFTFEISFVLGLLPVTQGVLLQLVLSPFFSITHEKQSTLVPNDGVLDSLRALWSDPQSTTLPFLFLYWTMGCGYLAWNISFEYLVLKPVLKAGLDLWVFRVHDDSPTDESWDAMLREILQEPLWKVGIGYFKGVIRDFITIACLMRLPLKWTARLLPDELFPLNFYPTTQTNDCAVLIHFFDLLILTIVMPTLFEVFDLRKIALRAVYNFVHVVGGYMNIEQQLLNPNAFQEVFGDDDDQQPFDHFIPPQQQQQDEPPPVVPPRELDVDTPTEEPTIDQDVSELKHYNSDRDGGPLDAVQGQHDVRIHEDNPDQQQRHDVTNGDQLLLGNDDSTPSTNKQQQDITFQKLGLVILGWAVLVAITTALLVIPGHIIVRIYRAVDPILEVIQFESMQVVYSNVTTLPLERLSSNRIFEITSSVVAEYSPLLLNSQMFSGVCINPLYSAYHGSLLLWPWFSLAEISSILSGIDTVRHTMLHTSKSVNWEDLSDYCLVGQLHSALSQNGWTTTTSSSDHQLRDAYFWMAQNSCFTDDRTSSSLIGDSTSNEINNSTAATRAMDIHDYTTVIFQYFFEVASSTHSLSSLLLPAKLDVLTYITCLISLLVLPFPVNVYKQVRWVLHMCCMVLLSVVMCFYGLLIQPVFTVACKVGLVLCCVSCSPSGFADELKKRSFQTLYDELYLETLTVANID